MNEKIIKNYMKNLKQNTDESGNVYVEMYNSYYPLETVKRMVKNYVIEAENLNIDLDKIVPAWKHCMLLIKTNSRNYLYGLIDEYLYEETNSKLNSQIVKIK